MNRGKGREREREIHRKKRQKERGIEDKRGEKGRGREEWTPVTLHANLTRAGCTTTTTAGDGVNENEEWRGKKKGKGKKYKRMERNGRASRMTIYEPSQ